MTTARRRQKLEAAHIDPITQLEEFLEQKGIQHWDAAIVTDGSGSKANEPCGWASFLVERHSAELKPFFGAMSCGSNNTAELMAFVEPLLYYSATRTAGPNGAPELRHVVLVTDSSYLAERRKIYACKRHLLLWRLMQAAEREGIVVQAVHIHRMTLELNRMADRVAGQTRRHLVALNPKPKP